MDPSAHAESHGAATCFHSSVLAGYRDKVGFRVIDYLSGNPTPARTIKVNWPTESAAACATFLRDLLR